MKKLSIICKLGWLFLCLFTAVACNLSFSLVQNQSNSPAFTPIVSPEMSGKTSHQEKEKAPVPYRLEKYQLQLTTPQKNESSETILSWQERIQFQDAPWLRLHFKDYNLGKKSYIQIVSLEDGGTQRLDAERLNKWQNGTAFFNGEAVELSLYIAPGETGIFINLEDVQVGERVQISADGNKTPATQCGTEDDRISSSDPAVGRIMPIGCTGWITSNGSNLTAGHCINSNTQVLQFNVPDSDSDGTINNPPPEDQYPIEPIANIDWIDGGTGNDWAVFETFENSNTGKLAVTVQGSFYRMTRDNNPSTVRITGYGIDDNPQGSSGGGNADNQTLQTYSDAFLGEFGNEIRYTVDTEGGNSGSPVINVSNGLTIGIHTFGLCQEILPLYNGGTSFEHNDLENAIQDFPHSNTIYVDEGHTNSIKNGSVFRPFFTVNEGVTTATNNPVLSIVAGNYNETMTINMPMRIESPVGTVIIGQ